MQQKRSRNRGEGGQVKLLVEIRDLLKEQNAIAKVQLKTTQVGWAWLYQMVQASMQAANPEHSEQSDSPDPGFPPPPSEHQ
jgi:hypothetical protein